jgi:hypothetical protein
METPFKHFFNDRIHAGTLDELTRGPLAAHLKTYAQQLRDEGYAVQTGQYQLRMPGHFNRWLQSQGFAADEIDSCGAEEKPASREKVTLQRSPACCVCFEQVKPRCPHRLQPPARLFWSSFSTIYGRSADCPRRRLCARRPS